MPPDAPIRPDFQTPRTFGLLNIVYAVGLMGFGLCQNLFFAIPAMVSMGGARVVVNGTTINAQSGPPTSTTAPSDLAARLEKLEAATTDPKERERVASLRRKEEADRLAPPPPIELARDPRLVGHAVFDLATGLTLNVLMLLSGVGLLFLKGWGRRLAVAVAWLKIVRLGCVAASMTLFAAPAAAAMMAAIAAPGEGPEVADPVRLLLVNFAWTLFLLGSIYPALTIHFLGRRSVRAAFSAAK